MEILGWVIWLVACGWGVVSLLAFFCEVFWPNPFPEGPEALYPPGLRRLITGFAALGFIAAAVATAVLEVSKLHLLWFVPVWHLFGIQRLIEWIYLSSSPDLKDFLYPESGFLWRSLTQSSLMRSIFRKKYQVQGRGLSVKGWERFPIEFVKGVRETLGAEKFDSLTLLAKKYRVFNQDLFADPDSFTDIHDELTNIEITGLLTSMGNDLCRRQIVDDAEKAYRITLALCPEHFAASGMLAVICHDSGRLCEARKYAHQAITDMESHAERYKDVPVPEHLADPNAIDSFRSILQSIAEGNASD